MTGFYLTIGDIENRLTEADFESARSVQLAVSRRFACGIDWDVAERILRDYRSGKIVLKNKN